MEEIKYFELFAGIGAPRSALERIANDTGLIKPISCGYSEIDNAALRQYSLLYDDVDNKGNWGDITKINKLPKNLDLLIHGSPCQSFSMAGNRSGAEKGSGTKSSLMWETVRLVEQSKPKVVIWENVKGVMTEKMLPYFNEYITKMEELGYTNSSSIISAVECGIPQNRERIFVASFLNGENYANIDNFKRKKMIPIEEMVDFENIPETPPTNSETYKKVFDRTKEEKSIFNCDVSDNFSISETTEYCSTLIRKNKCKKNRLKWCYITPKERFLLSGFTEEQFDKVKHLSPNQIVLTTGNTIVVNVLEQIFRLIYLGEEKEEPIQEEFKLW